MISGHVWMVKHLFSDWSMVSKATINQPEVTLVRPNDPTNRCAESLYPFLFGVGTLLYEEMSSPISCRYYRLAFIETS